MPKIGADSLSKTAENSSTVVLLPAVPFLRKRRLSFAPYCFCDCEKFFGSSSNPNESET